MLERKKGLEYPNHEVEKMMNKCDVNKFLVSKFYTEY